MNNLFSPLRIREVEFKNRIVVSPMCQYSSKDGFANDWHLVHLGSRAVGGAALVMTEATAVSPEGRISPEDLGIWKDEHLEMLSRIAKFIEGQGAVAGIQLAHAGRKASKTSPWNGNTHIHSNKGGWRTFAPSPLPFSEEEEVPVEMTLADIKKVKEDFVQAAKRALNAGFKVAEIHAAHGYLIHEFYSPLSNKRNDNYGSSFENRIRLLIEITEEVRKVWPEGFPLFVRISASDWYEKGWDIEDSIRLAPKLKELGVDLIDCSSGGNIKQAKIEVGPGYQVPFAEAVKKKGGIMTGAVGLIISAEQANKIVQEKKADMVFLAREFLRDPYFPLTAANKLDADIKWPVQYERAKRRH